MAASFFFMKRLSFIIGLVISCSVYAQKVSIDPTISPETVEVDQEITITYDVTGTDLADLDEAWLWTVSYTHLTLPTIYSV